jgi:predicted MFS family arabinose efflux permease
MLAWPLPFWGFALSTVIWTTGEIVSSINMGVFLARHSPANWRASFQSFMGVCYSAGWVFGPLIGGVLLKGGNYALLWLATAVVCLLWALLAFAVDRWDRRILAYEA